ncbi:MAG: glycosyltransferase, partial [Oscillospiraceae bacterium]|nr:glycosyltransferase [Oscillospiraceae bacterium]
MRLLHIISDTNLGGAGRVLLNYLAFRDRSAFDVEVALPRGSALTAREELRDVRVHELDGLRDKSFDLSAVRALSRLIGETAPDLVHTHGAFSGRVAAKRRGVPVVFTRHSAFPPSPRLTKGLGKAAFRTVTARYSDRIIAVSDVCRDGLVRCGVPPGKIDVILNGTPP